MYVKIQIYDIHVHTEIRYAHGFDKKITKDDGSL